MSNFTVKIYSREEEEEEEAEEHEEEQEQEEYDEEGDLQVWRKRTWMCEDVETRPWQEMRRVDAYDILNWRLIIVWWGRPCPTSHARGTCCSPSL